MTTLAPIDDWYERIPKAELHLHLEGAIPLDALWALVEAYGGDAEVPTPAALAARFAYRDFPHFIDTWVWKNQFLKRYEDFTFIAEAVARDLVRQNIVYVEAFCSPIDFARHGLTTGRLLEAIRAGLDRVPELESHLVVDLVRDFGPAEGARVLAEVIEARELGVLGVGIGGSEQSFPPEPWAEVFAEARRHGLRTSAHAGEAAGAASVWGAVRDLKVDRIGHGTRAAEDPALVALLAERRLPIEMCPLSNLRTGVVASLAEHPIRDFIDRGLCVTVNTDDPAMFNNSLADEYRQLAAVHGLSRAAIRDLVFNALSAAWTDDARKAQLHARFTEAFAACA